MAAPPAALSPPPWALPHLPGGTGPPSSWPSSGEGGWIGGGAPPAPLARPPPPTTTSAAPTSTSSQPAALDLAVSYLKQRDGIDKLLKLVRYTCRLALVSGSVAAPSLASARLDALQASIGDARKAYRLGKFLQGIQAGRKAGGWPALTGSLGAGAFLAALAAAGDACYYFLEQGTWLVRARAAPPHWGPPIARASAAAELVSYIGSSGLVLAALDSLALREVALLKAARIAAWDGRDGSEVEAELATLRARRAVLRAALAQDACDALLALADLREGKGGLLGSKPVLAGAGLASAILGARKVWLATTRSGGGGGGGDVKKNV